MSERTRNSFERFYRSVHGDKHSMARSHLGYQDDSVDRAFFFWLAGREGAKA
ncbi:hypothetical protein [Pantoea piersonii]|uniref:hypothetical protein n=1 Tax=Pantoea piersonii TaxID=2364647 RepID=UPI00289D5234|nr:hypothetical protein [Pantoea piersonii]